MDCFFDPETDATPDFATVDDAHTQMVDQAVVVDKSLMEMYLEPDDEMAPEQLHDAAELALRDGHLMPV